MKAMYEARTWLDLALYDTPTISNAIEPFNQRPYTEGFCTEMGMREVGQGRSIVGCAVTATMRSPLDQLVTRLLCLELSMNKCTFQ